MDCGICKDPISREDSDQQKAFILSDRACQKLGIERPMTFGSSRIEAHARCIQDPSILDGDQIGLWTLHTCCSLSEENRSLRFKLQIAGQEIINLMRLQGCSEQEIEDFRSELQG